MLRFAVYDQNGLAEGWPLDSAYLVGVEEQAVPGSVRYQDGYIECRPRGGQATALSIQFETDEHGVLMLQTCLLPEREEPYILAVELARHRIKTFLAKSEEWQMFELGTEHAAMRDWERARRLFTEAITAGDPAAADRTARGALTFAIRAAERLALTHADILLRRRFGMRAASPTTLGVRVWPARDTAGLREVVGRDFDVVVVPLRWSRLEVEEGRYRWDETDRWIGWAQTTGKPIVAGPLIDFSPGALPKWMYVWQHDYDTCRDLAYDHMMRVLHRYGAAVGMWNIASGINVNDNFQFTPEQMFDLTRMAALGVKQTRPKARVMVELCQPFGEHCALRRNAIAPVSFIERVVQEGIKVHAVGVQVLLGRRDHGAAARDLMQISSMLDRFFLVELPVLVSAMGVPSEPVDPGAGSWHGEWTPALQAQWAARMFMIAMSKPYVETIFWSDLYDHDEAEIRRTGLIDGAGRPKPALARLLGFRRRLRKPLGRAGGPTPLEEGDAP
ncbi:MAG: endo-1,4-beta-xylanase [Planctomycetota bacterium]|jgi:GH35 family endo-1,4-beta-xylanase